MNRWTYLVLFLSILVLSGCVTSIDRGLPYTELPKIRLASELALVASPGHPLSTISSETLSPGSIVSVIGSDENAAWLLVLSDDTLGWMPTIFSETNIGKIPLAVQGEPLSAPCFQFAGTTSEIDRTWTSTFDGQGLIVGIVLHPSGPDIPTPMNLQLDLHGAGVVSESEYLHFPVTEENTLLLFSFTVVGLEEDSRIALQSDGIDDATMPLRVAYFEASCQVDPAKLTIEPYFVMPVVTSGSNIPGNSDQTVTNSFTLPDPEDEPVVVTVETELTSDVPQETPLLAPEQSQKGSLFQGEINRYMLDGYENTPLLFTVSRENGDLCYYVNIVDSLGKKLGSWGRMCDGIQRFSFTPQHTEQIWIELIQDRAGGDYSLSVDWLDAPPEERDQQKSLEPAQPVTGTLGERAWDDWIVDGHENVPVLFSVERTRGDLCYYVNVFDSEGERLSYWGRYCSGQQRFAFTPLRTEELTVQIYADSYYGEYSFEMDWLDSPPDERSLDVTLETDTQYHGRIGIGAHDDYILAAYENVPYLFSVERERGDLCYYVTVYDSEGERLNYWGRFCGGQQRFAFTPLRTEELIVQISADSHYGDYLLESTWLDAPPEQRNLEVTLEPAVSHEGRLGIGAYDDFFVAGHENVPLLFTVERERGDLCYYVNIYDTEGERLNYWGRFCSGRQTFAYTPERSQPLVVRIYADSSFGNYSLQVDWLDAAPDRRNLLTDLVEGAEYEGRLGVGAWDDYRFEASAGTSVTISTERMRNELCYYVNLYGSDGERLAYWGRYCSNRQSIEYEIPASGEYTLRIYADSGYGAYRLIFDRN